MKQLLLLLLFITGQTFAQTPVEPYVVMVSLDGFRHDYVQRFQPPHLLRLIKEGTQATSMIPIYPSKTFPNHYTLVTGMHAGKHGIIDNPFYDSQIDAVYNSGNREVSMQPIWYNGTPLWQLAQAQGMKTAAYYWIGSELPIKGQYPTYYQKYDAKVPNEARIAKISEWLNLPAADRPRFISVYFSLVDDAGHRFGPDSPEMGKAVLRADSLLGKLYDDLQKISLPVNLFVVSDHGMEQMPSTHDNFINIEKIADLRDSTINFFTNSVHAHIYFKDKNKAKIAKVYNELRAKAQNYTVYYQKDIPKHWHYQFANRTGDLLVVAKPPFIIGGNAAEKKYQKEPFGGQHGYDPYLYKNMHAIFYAWGPNIKQGHSIPSFGIIHVYPFLAYLLGLETPKDIDGNLKVLKGIKR